MVIVECPRCHRMVPVAPLEEIGRADDYLATPVAHVVLRNEPTPCPPLGTDPYGWSQQSGNLLTLLDEIPSW